MKHLLSLVFIAFLLTGCAFFQPVETPKATSTPQTDLYQTLAEAIKKSIAITSGSFDNNFNITFQNAPDMTDRFTVNMKGNWNAPEKKSLSEITLSLDLQNSENKDLPTHGTAKAHIAMDNKKQIVRLNSINLVGEESEPINQSLKLLIGEWYLIPPGNTYPLNFMSSLVYENQNNQQILQAGKYFQILDASFVQMNEEQAHHLVVTLDKEGTKAVLRKLQAANPETLNPDRLVEWENIIDNASFQGDIFIGKDSGYIRKFQGELTIIGSKNNNQQIILAIDVELQNINENVPISIPQAEKVLDPLSLLGNFQ